MKDFDAVELFKNTAETNATDWLKETNIISFGTVVSVDAPGIVTVQQIVREGISSVFVTVPLMSVGSSLLEEGAEPKENDLVLLLFLDKYHGAMFESVAQRILDTGDAGIQDSDSVGYSKSSGVGILLSPFKGLAETIVRHFMDGDTPAMLMRSRAKLTAIFKREVEILFDSLPDSSGLVDRLVRLTFGQNSPSMFQHWAAVTREHGFCVLPDNSLQTVVAPVVERYSTMAPITKDIQGIQTITIGKGTSPAGDPGGSPVDTHAPVSIDIGADADITLTSKSGVTLHFDGPFTLTVNGKVKIDGQDTVEILAGVAKLSKIGNNLDTLGTLLDSIAGTLSGTPPMLVSGGSGAPAVGIPNPAFVSAVTAWQARVDAVLS